MTTRQIIPILGPVLALIKSRKGLLYVVSLAVMLLIAYVPAMEEVRQQLSDVLLIVFGLITTAMLAAIGFEDGQSKAAGNFPVRVDAIDFAPLWHPFVSLLRSRKVIVWLATVLVGFTVTNLPDLEPLEGQLTDIYVLVVGVITSALLGAIAYEDGNAKKPSPAPAAAQIDMAVSARLAQMMDEDARPRTVRGEDLPTLLRKTGS